LTAWIGLIWQHLLGGVIQPPGVGIQRADGYNDGEHGSFTAQGNKSDLHIV